MDSFTFSLLTTQSKWKSFSSENKKWYVGINYLIPIPVNVSTLFLKSHGRVLIYFTPIIMKLPVYLTGDSPKHNNICTYNSMLNTML
jgi:hypothetical protein